MNNSIMILPCSKISEGCIDTLCKEEVYELLQSSVFRMSVFQPFLNDKLIAFYRLFW